MSTNQAKIDKLARRSDELRDKVHSFSYNYIHNSDVRMAFSMEEDDFIRNIKKEVGQYCLSYDAGISMLEKELENLNRQKFELDMSNAQLYMIAERKKEKNSFVTITLKRVGFVGGALQIYAGGVVCGGTLGLACAGFGTPMIAHGSENMYENGYYLLFREDVSGYTKDAYRYVANTIGYSNDDADIVYNVADLGLSGYGLGRQVLKPDAWKLFRYISTDYTRGWKLMGTTELGAEAVIDTSTMYSIYQIKKED